jgi:hypothetical protein
MNQNPVVFDQYRRQKTISAFIAFAAVLFTVGSLWYANRSPVPPMGPPKEPTKDELVAQGKAMGYKIFTTEELAKRFQKDPKNLLIVDTRQEWEYRTAHIAGSVLFPTETTWWWRWRNASAMAKLLGPDKDRTTVYY